MAKICRNCRKKFEPIYSSLQQCCGTPCAIEWAKTEKGQKEVQKAHRKENREHKRGLKTRSDWIKEAQKEFNKYIRIRDRDLPCVSCGVTDSELRQFATGGSWDCSHYRSIGSCPELRFEPMNAAKACKRCNRDLSGNIVEFRIELEKRIGPENLAWLEGKHDPKKYTIEQLKEIRDHYRELVKEAETA